MFQLCGRALDAANSDKIRVGHVDAELTRQQTAFGMNKRELSRKTRDNGSLLSKGIRSKLF